MTMNPIPVRTPASFSFIPRYFRNFCTKSRGFPADFAGFPPSPFPRRPSTFEFLSPKVERFMPCTTDDLCQLVSKFVQSFSKYSVHNFSNRRTNGRMKGHAVRILYTILRTWSSGGITKHVNLVIYIIKPSFSNVLLVQRNAKNKHVKMACIAKRWDIKPSYYLRNPTDNCVSNIQVRKGRNIV